MKSAKAERGVGDEPVVMNAIDTTMDVNVDEGDAVTEGLELKALMTLAEGVEAFHIQIHGAR
jgi:hypothetical protein